MVKINNSERTVAINDLKIMRNNLHYMFNDRFNNAIDKGIKALEEHKPSCLDNKKLVIEKRFNCQRCKQDY